MLFRSLGSDEKPLLIIPGMVASVDIMTGKKSILSYLLKPIIRARAEAAKIAVAEGGGTAIDLALLAEEIGRGIGVNVNGISSKERRFLNRRWSALVCDAT